MPRKKKALKAPKKVYALLDQERGLFNVLYMEKPTKSWLEEGQTVITYVKEGGK